MSRRLLSLLGFRPGDLRIVLPLFALQAGVAAYWAAAASAGDALLLSFLRERSLSVQAVVPWTYVAIAAAAALTMAAFDALQRRLPRRVLMISAPLALSASVSAFRPLLALDAAWIRFALLVWLEVVALVSMTLAFSLTGDCVRSRDAKRLYGFIGGGFCVGLAGGGAAVPWIARSFGAESLLLVAAGLLLANAAVAAAVPRGARPAGGDGPVEPAPPLRALAADPSLRLLAGAVFLGAALFVFVDFQLKSLASGLPRDEIAALYGRLYAWAGAGEAVIQFGLLRALIRRAGVLNLQLLYPAAMAAGAAAMAAVPGLGTAAGVNLLRMVSAESVERPTRELLFLPLAERVRARAQALIDGAVAPCGQAAAALAALGLAAATSDPRALPLAALATAALALACVLRLRPRYRLLLASALRSQALGSMDLARLAREPGAPETLAEMLASPDERESALARAVLEEAGELPRPPRPEPDGAWGLDEPGVSSPRRCALAADAGRRGGPSAGPALWSLLPSADSALTAAAARAALEVQRREGWEGPPPLELKRRRALEEDALVLLAGARRRRQADPFLREALDDFARVRLDALLSLHALNGGPDLEGARRELRSPDPAARAAALELAEELLPARAVAALSAWADPEPEAPARPPAAMRAALAALDPALGRLLDGGEEALRAARLRGRALLSGLETPYLLQLLESSEGRSLSAGETLFREGEPGDALFLIEEGSLSVRAGGREVAVLGPGECLGELSVLDGRPRSAEAVAAAPARVLALERGAFRDVAAGRPAVGFSLLRTLESRLRSTLPPVPQARAAARAALVASGDPGARRRLLTTAALRRVPLLDGLPDSALAAVAGLARPVPVFAGETLFERGERGESLFLIAEGRVLVEADGTRLAELGPGDSVGELALISGLGRTATVRVAADGLLFAVGAADFERLLRDEPSVLWALLETLAGRLRSSLSGPACAPRRS